MAVYYQKISNALNLAKAGGKGIALINGLLRGLHSSINLLAMGRVSMDSVFIPNEFQFSIAPSFSWGISMIYSCLWL
tara:strand:- start:5457 stop:5687 length:231 start_codon:yes stop_codon:yes gene_type:complete